eukprot:4429430-Pyramimonas_sp.AAC.1
MSISLLDNAPVRILASIPTSAKCLQPRSFRKRQCGPACFQNAEARPHFQELLRAGPTLACDIPTSEH